MPSFISELRRRNVFRVATAYALVAWIIIEAGSVLLPTFGAAEGVFRTYVILVIIGFLVALIFAWIFEITPEGVKLDKDVDRSTAAPGKPTQAFNYAIIALLIVALAVSITFNVTGVRDLFDAPPPESTSARRSIAVLPFASLSNDPDNLIFVDGMHDDLLTRLAKLGSLKVISRTSVLEYRDTAKNLRQIGDELGVETLLEGTVQKVGDNVRINVQLIDVATDAHLWAQTYDRQLSLENIFTIQREISTAISSALHATLLPQSSALPDTMPTGNIRAYSLYVSGRDSLYLRRLETLLDARQKFEQAIQLDPEYAEAYVALAECNLLLNINHGAISQSEAYESAREYLDTALQLDPELSDAYATEGLLKTTIWSNSRLGTENLEAEAAFEYAISLNPNNAQAYMWFASLRDSEQRLNDAIGLYHRSMQLDPLARIPYSNLPMLYAQLGQNEVALKLWLEAIEIHPEWPTPYQYVANHLHGLGRLDEAVAWNLAAQELSTDPILGGNVDVGVYLQFGEIDIVRQIIEQLPASHPLSDFLPVFDRYFERDFAGSLAAFDDAAGGDAGTQPYLYGIAAEIALLAGDFERAREYVLRQSPVLGSDEDQPIDRFTVGYLTTLAYIDSKTGNTENAQRMLNAMLPVVQSLPRLGMFGQGIRDVQILAMLGRTEAALQALRAAVADGFRSSIPFNNWLLGDDPYLETIRDDPRFKAIMTELDALNEVMRERVANAADTGNWQALRKRAGAG